MKELVAMALAMIVIACGWWIGVTIHRVLDIRRRYWEEYKRRKP